MITCPDPLNCRANLRTGWMGHESMVIAEWNNLVNEYIQKNKIGG